MVSNIEDNIILQIERRIKDKVNQMAEQSIITHASQKQY